jgi:activator of HSP90 ATPase
MMTASQSTSTSGNSTNWKNVNNWHWVEKNCLPWAQEYLGEKLKGLQVTKGPLQVQIDAVSSVSGDVDLNQRKGKVITIYDLAIKMDWKGTSCAFIGFVRERVLRQPNQTTV